MTSQFGSSKSRSLRWFHCRCFCVNKKFCFKGKKCEEEIKLCSPSPCLHGGICTQLDVTKYRCDCIHGVYGDLCQFVAMATFDGKSIVKVRGHEKVKRSVSDLESTADIGFGQGVTLEEVQRLSRIKRQTVYPSRINLWFSTSILKGTVLLMTGVSVFLI